MVAAGIVVLVLSAMLVLACTSPRRAPCKHQRTTISRAYDGDLEVCDKCSTIVSFEPVPPHEPIYE